MPYIIGALFAIGLLAWIFIEQNAEAKRNGTYLGMAGVKTAFLWNHADADQRSLMLASIGITEDPYRKTLLSEPFDRLPALVAISLSKTLQEIRDEQKAVPKVQLDSGAERQIPMPAHCLVSPRADDWNHANANQRASMLAAIGITEALPVDALSELPWEQLPELIAKRLSDSC